MTSDDESIVVFSVQREDVTRLDTDDRLRVRLEAESKLYIT